MSVASSEPECNPRNLSVPAPNDGGPGFAEINRKRRRATSQWMWALVPLGLVLVCGFSLLGSSVKAPPELSNPAGWVQLGECAFTKSLDGKKVLKLLYDGSAQLLDALANDAKERRAIGAWTYDEVTRSYSITLNNTTRSYSLVSPEFLSTCILFSGSIDVAKLRDSWFPSEDDDPGDYDYRPGP
jgi:hypothetical protein